MKVNYVFDIPADPFEMLSKSGEKVWITPPCSWSGLAPVKARLISAEWREGQVRWNNSELYFKDLHNHGLGRGSRKVS